MMIPSRFRRPVANALGLLFLGLGWSCSSDRPSTENTDAGQDSKATKKTTVAAAPTTIDQVNVFLEVSGSMKGFMPTNQEQGITEFQKTIDPFLATIYQENRIAGKAFFEVREKPYLIGYDKLANTVRYGIKQSASSTTIPAILDSIITNYSGGVNVLISDFIYAPENGRAVSFVATDIYRVLAKARQQGQALSVFGATSAFNGTFYPAMKGAQKTLSPCCATPIPYYVWVVGKPEQVRLFNREVVKNTFSEEVHVGFAFAAPAFGVLDKFLPAGAWYCGGSGECRDVVISDLTSPAEMVVGLNLHELPAAFSGEAYLKQHLRLVGENSDAKITSIWPADRFRQLPEVAGKNTDPLKPYTHFVKIRLTRLNAPQTELRLQLANQRPAWVQQWTTADDSSIDQEGAKTFNLAGIIDGVDRAFGGGGAGNIFDLALTLRKEK